MCIDTCMDMCIDMCADMRLDMRTDMGVDMSIDMRMNMHIDMCIDMCTAMCTDSGPTSLRLLLPAGLHWNRVYKDNFWTAAFGSVLRPAAPAVATSAQLSCSNDI